MRFRLDHIGLVVDDISEFRRIFRALGPVAETEPMADPIQKVAASFLSVHDAADVYVEVLEPTDERSPVMNFLKKRGGGLHHLCFEVEDIDAAVKRFREEGFAEVCQTVPCPTYDENLGRDCCGTTKIAFFMLTDHLLVELIEKG
jgi:methylmalonyl-CoA epimerase